MKRYFAKKYIFAGIFIVLLYTISIINISGGLGSVKEVLNKYGKTLDYAKAKELVVKLESTINDNLVGKMKFIESYGYIQRLLGKNELDNFSYVKDRNGFLNYASFYRESDPMISEYAKRVRRLKESLPGETKVLFISPPSKYSMVNSDFPSGFPVNDPSDRQDELLLKLLENGVDTLDLRPPLEKSGLSYEKSFYKTDHHWSIEAAFIAFSAIVEEMNSKYGLNLDSDGFYRDLQNYNVQEYPESMLGTMGRSTGITYGGLDDFTLIWPKFETDFIWEGVNEEGEKKHKEGSFEESLLQLEVLNNENPYSYSKYDTYIDCVNAWDKIVNKNNPEGLKILCIRDSYFSPTMSFLSSLCSEIHMIWPLASGNKIDVEEYLEDNSFDYIFVELYPYNIEEKAFPYFK